MATSPLAADPPLSLEPVLGWRVWELTRSNYCLHAIDTSEQERWVEAFEPR